MYVSLGGKGCNAPKQLDCREFEHVCSTSYREQRPPRVAEKPSGTRESQPLRAPNSRPTDCENSTRCEPERKAPSPPFRIRAKVLELPRRLGVYGMPTHMTSTRKRRWLQVRARRSGDDYRICRLRLGLARMRNQDHCVRTPKLCWAEIAVRLDRAAVLLLSQHSTLKSINEHDMNRNHYRQRPSKCDMHYKQRPQPSLKRVVIIQVVFRLHHHRQLHSALQSLFG